MDEPLDLDALAKLAELLELSTAEVTDAIMVISHRSSINLQNIGIHTNMSPREAESFAHVLRSVPRLIADLKAARECIKTLSPYAMHERCVDND